MSVAIWRVGRKSLPVGELSWRRNQRHLRDWLGCLGAERNTWWHDLISPVLNETAAEDGRVACCFAMWSYIVLTPGTGMHMSQCICYGAEAVVWSTRMFQCHLYVWISRSTSAASAGGHAQCSGLSGDLCSRLSPSDCLYTQHSNLQRPWEVCERKNVLSWFYCTLFKIMYNNNFVFAFL